MNYFKKWLAANFRTASLIGLAAIVSLFFQNCSKVNMIEDISKMSDFSSLSTSIGSNVFYEEKSAAVVINFSIMNQDKLTPISSSALTKFKSGDDVYIKWKLLKAESGIGERPFKLSYTTDGVNFNAIGGEYINGSNGSCSVDIEYYTGCLHWKASAPSSDFFYVRLEVKDLAGQVSLFSSNGANMGNLNLIAGTFDTGMGGSAKSALIFRSSDMNNLQPGRLLVTGDENIYLTDSRGLLRILKSSKKLELIASFSSESVDGPQGTYKISPIYKMAFDPQGNIIFAEANAIRKYDLTSQTVITLIGGGTTQTTGARESGRLGLEYPINVKEFPNLSDLVVLPSGDIFFTDSGLDPIFDKVQYVRYYRPADKKVYHIEIDGSGGYGAYSAGGVANSSTNFADPTFPTKNPNKYYLNKGFGISFDPATGEVKEFLLKIGYCGGIGCGHTHFVSRMKLEADNQGIYTKLTSSGLTQDISAVSQDQVRVSYGPAQDGGLYYGSKWATKSVLSRFDFTTRKWVSLIAEGGGECTDGTIATNCLMDLYDFTVSTSGKLYVIDRGIIRKIETDGTIVTLYGQRRSFGDGYLASTARIGEVETFGLSNTGEVVFYDSLSMRIRSFFPGKTIETIAGNGSVESFSDAKSAINMGLYPGYWGADARMLVAGSGDLYMNFEGSIAKLSRRTGVWKCIFMCTGYSPFTVISAGDGKDAKGLYGRYYPALIGLSDENLMIESHEWTSTLGANKARQSLINLNTNILTHIAGNDGASKLYSTVGASIENQEVLNSFYGSVLPAYFDSKGGFYITTKNSKILYYVGSDKILNLAARTSKAVNSFTIVENETERSIYYCGITSASLSKLYKIDLNTNTETELAWPSNVFSCTGQQIFYSETRKSLIFPTKQFLMTSFAEFSL